jgi:hypothetical protein
MVHVFEVSPGRFSVCFPGQSEDAVREMGSKGSTAEFLPVLAERVDRAMIKYFAMPHMGAGKGRGYRSSSRRAYR